MAKLPVIILAFANDQKGSFLRSIAEEHRGIRNSLRALSQQGIISLEELPNAQIEDIYAAFRRNKDRVRIFHYGGHAEDFSLLLNASEQPLDIHAFSQYLFQQKGLKLAFMNGCTTLPQKEALEQAGIPNLILTHKAIGDQAAKEFSRKFYENLASGREIKRSFDEAVAESETQVESFYRSMHFGEEEQENAQVPWELFQAAPDTWTLPNKPPFPVKKWALAISLILALLLSVMGYRAYFQPYEVNIPLQFPVGVEDFHFDLKHTDIKHTVIFQLKEGSIVKEIGPGRTVEIPQVKGIGEIVPIKVESSLWASDEAEYLLSRDPKPLQLKWAPRLQTIQGKVLDEHDKPARGVQVLLKEGKAKTISDEDGNYSISIPEELIPSMEHNFILSKEGYPVTTFMINVSDPMEYYNLFLSKSEEESLSEIPNE